MLRFQLYGKKRVTIELVVNGGYLGGLLIRVYQFVKSLTFCTWPVLCSCQNSPRSVAPPWIDNNALCDETCLLSSSSHWWRCDQSWNRSQSHMRRFPPVLVSSLSIVSSCSSADSIVSVTSCLALTGHHRISMMEPTIITKKYKYYRICHLESAIDVGQARMG